jgi:hypothetical protein
MALSLPALHDGNARRHERLTAALVQLSLKCLLLRSSVRQIHAAGHIRLRSWRYPIASTGRIVCLLFCGPRSGLPSIHPGPIFGTAAKADKQQNCGYLVH